MKLRLQKSDNHWHSGVYRGKGGVNSLVAARVANSLWYCLGVFTFKNIYKTLTEK